MRAAGAVTAGFRAGLEPAPGLVVDQAAGARDQLTDQRVVGARCDV
ncbi:MAG: hypothetical protein GYB64_13550 [Chloroflexi bacterium]|nr:hypothetical protein [Chloroflexota bacterium]